MPNYSSELPKILSINHKEKLNSFVDYGTPLLTFLFYFQPFLTGRLFLYPWKAYMRNERNCQAILHSLPCPCYHADCFTHYGGSCGGKAILDDGQGKRRAWLKRLWMTAVSALHSMKAGSSLREKPPIVSTSTRTLFLATRPEPMQAHAWVPTDKRRCLSLEYVKQYAKTHNNLNDKQAYLLEQCVVWQRLSVHLGWECDNVRASYDEIPKSVQDEVYTGAEAFVKANKGRYECGGYLRRVFR